jgi:two-component system, response regulator PdtaR
MESVGIQTPSTELKRQPDTGPVIGTATPRRVLIVEDNVFVAQQCSRALTEAGYEVIGTLTTADEAIEVALRQRPDMVLMDIYLCGTRDGIEAALEIFQRSGIRSVYASAVSDAGMQARAALTHPLAWLPKPFNDRKLVATVKAALSELDRLTRSPMNARTPAASAQSLAKLERKASVALAHGG